MNVWRPMIFCVVNSYGVANIKTAALQDALCRNNLGHLQFGKITSIIPWKAKEVPVTQFPFYPAGTILPAILSVKFVPFPPEHPEIHGTSLFFLPYFTVSDPNYRHTLVLEDTFEHIISNENLEVEAVADRTRLYLSLYHEVTVGKLAHHLRQYGRAERILNTVVGITPNKEKNETDVFVMKVDTKEPTAVTFVNKLYGTGFIALISAVIFGG
jgi:hypothetical protein